MSEDGLLSCKAWGISRSTSKSGPRPRSQELIAMLTHLEDQEHGVLDVLNVAGAQPWRDLQTTDLDLQSLEHAQHVCGRVCGWV